MKSKHEIEISERLDMIYNVSMAFGSMLGCVIVLAILNETEYPERIAFASCLALSLVIIAGVFKFTRDAVERL